MIKHYFKIALRNLQKHKVFSIINIAGLSIGLTCCLLMSVYIQHELSYDNFQDKGNRIARVIMEYSFDGREPVKANATSTHVLPAFKRNFPEIEDGVRMSKRARIVKLNDKLFSEKSFMYADSTFFNLFSFVLLQGSPKDVLSGLNKVILTQSAAQKYFGNANPVGKTLQVGADAQNYQITGVLKDCPGNSQIKFDFLASFSSLGQSQDSIYWNANYTTYLLLKNKAGFAGLQSKIPGFIKKEMQFTGNDYLTFNLEPFNSIHLHSVYGGFEPNNSITYIYIVAVVALLMLLIACFTYVNLSTARSMERAKEVGIRKVAGALKGQVFGQFIGESVLVSLLALLLSIVLALLLLPAFGTLAERSFTASDLLSPFTVVFSIVVVVCISLLAGGYPAFVLSSYMPVKVLKGAFKNTGSGMWIRKSLTVFQFVISAFLIVCAFIITSQLHYIQNKDLGFNREHVLVLPLDDKMHQKMTAVKAEFKSIAGVKNVAVTVNDPTNIYGGYSIKRAEDPEDKTMAIAATPVDDEFIPATGIKILAGENITPQDLKDAAREDAANPPTYKYMINEAAVKAMGYKSVQDAVGQRVSMGDSRPGTIKAVVKDFNANSMHEVIKPIVLFTEDWGTMMLIKVSGGNLQQIITALETKWKTLAPYRPFEYHFLDEDYDRLYSADMRLGKVLSIFTGIAIVLACLGLFGLSAYSIQQRTKEIGIRKVLGASVQTIVVLLSKEFVQLVIMSLLIAFPIAWWAMNNWLQDFAYRITIAWWMFAIAAFAAISIALITISFRSIKVALSNPVDSLRTE